MPTINDLNSFFFNLIFMRTINLKKILKSQLDQNSSLDYIFK